MIMNNIILFNHFNSSKKKDHNLKMPGLGYLKMIYSRFLLKTVLHNYFINLGRSSSCLNCHVSWTTLYLPHFWYLIQKQMSFWTSKNWLDFCTLQFTLRFHFGYTCQIFYAKIIYSKNHILHNCCLSCSL